MKITKEMLDKKICEFEECFGEDMTYRSWIKDWEDWHCLEHKDLDSMSNEELNNYFKYIDYLVSN